MYNYYDVVKEDVKNYIKENYESLEEVKKGQLYDDCFLEDSITGNASGSYYCNAYKAKESLFGNESLLEDVINEYGIDMQEHWNDWEYLDVSIRCYLVYECIDDALEELENEGF